jgi:hypothetical protein
MKRIYSRIYFALLIINLTSCQLIFKETSYNKKFEDQYSDDIEKIKQSRNAQTSPKEDLEKLLTPTLQNDTNLDGSNSFDYVGMSHFGSNQKKYFPDYETYEQGKFSNPSDQFSPKIFEISYNTYLNQPFTRSGVEFDFIEIPESDSFGIKSLNEKASEFDTGMSETDMKKAIKGMEDSDESDKSEKREKFINDIKNGDIQGKGSKKDIYLNHLYKKIVRVAIKVKPKVF